MAPASEFNFVTTLLPLAGIVFLIAIGVILLNQHFRKNLYQQMLAQEALKTLHQQGLLKSSVEVQEKERKRIARDMHDELGTALSLARMQLVQLEQKQSANNPELSVALHHIRTTTEAVLASMRRLSHELMPPQLESFGLIKTLQSVCAQVNDTQKLSVHMNVPAEWQALPKTIELALYRICMEMIHNTIKHAGASNIHIDLLRDEHGVVFHYHDDGKGLPQTNPSSGLGLRNIEARASIIGASLQTGNGAQGGFSASLFIPVNQLSMG